MTKAVKCQHPKREGEGFSRFKTKSLFVTSRLSACKILSGCQRGTQAASGLPKPAGGSRDTSHREGQMANALALAGPSTHALQTQDLLVPQLPGFGPHGQTQRSCLPLVPMGQGPSSEKNNSLKTWCQMGTKGPELP